MSVLLRLSRLPGVKQGLAIPSAKAIVCRGMCKVMKKAEDSLEVGENNFITKKPWVSFGFDPDDQENDRAEMRQTMFASVTVALVGGVYIMWYMPDPNKRDWAQREAYIQLRYREENGLPLIDPNVVDPAKLKLPKQEDLKKFVLRL